MSDSEQNPSGRSRGAGRKRAETSHMDAVAEALKDAAGAIGNGEAQAGAQAPSARGPVSKVVYNLSYGVSFGVVLPFALVASLIPVDNPLGHGIMDGARAAVDKVDALKGEHAAHDKHDAHAGMRAA